jgi:hypothetical protein
MIDVDAEHLLELSPADDQDQVETVTSDGAGPALGKRVRFRGLEGCADHFNTLAAEDLVEAKLAMPMQQGVWTHEERWPSSEEPAGCSEKHTIGNLQTKANDLAAKNRELVSKHDDLELLESRERKRSAASASAEQIHKRDEQEQTSSTTMSYGLKARRINS